MSQWDDLGIAILAGGQSTRMGQDKAELEVFGEAMLASTASLALATGAPVLIVGPKRHLNWHFLDDESQPRAEPTFVPDQAPNQGPLGGLVSALRWNALSISKRPSLLLLPCDLPLLEASALEWIAQAASTCRARDGLATTRGGEMEPLFSIYAAEVENHARKYLEAGRRSLRGLIEGGEFEKRECPEEVAAQLFNCNTPEDLEQARGKKRR